MLEWIPDRPALTAGSSCSVDALVRITPPQQERAGERLPLHLALVIDRSGSMSGEKIELTRRAAALLTRSLRATDRLSIVLFDDQVEVLWPSSPVSDKEAILRCIEGIQVRGSTALFDGWKAGADQLLAHLQERQLNRILLLTDGEANVGETNPDSIGSRVKQVCARGVHTTTLGFGQGYNENLLRSMAASGEGNHFFVETPDQLAGYFELELEGLNATVGTRVRLKLLALHPEVKAEPLGEVQRDREGCLMLADLIDGYPMEQLFRLTLPDVPAEESLIEAELTWYSPALACSQSQRVGLRLPRVSEEERAQLPAHPAVLRQLAIAMAARARREATAAANQGDREGARSILERALDTRDLPEGDKLQLQQFKATLERGDISSFNKQSVAYSYAYSRSSVTLADLGQALLEGLVAQGAVLRASDWLHRPLYRRARPWARLVGAVAALVEAEKQAGGDEAGALSLVALRTLRGGRFLQEWTAYGRALAEAPVQHPSPEFVAFRGRLSAQLGLSSGSDAPQAEALARLAPMLLARWNDAGTACWPYLVLGCNLTHYDAMAAAANIAWARLLVVLMALEDPSAAAPVYLSCFVSALDMVETERKYAARCPRFDGWEGRLSEFLASALPAARARGLTFEQAAAEWGHSSYLLEMIPSLLYLLELHGHEPEQALQRAISGPYASPTLAALTGAALGALHGVLPGYAPRGEVELLLEEQRQRLKESF